MYVTCYSRQPSIIEQNGILPFWSYHMILNGNSILLNEVILNILLFIPTGYILSILLRKKSYAIIVCFLISSGIEIPQLITHRGLFEFDDIINNTLGGYLGIFLYQFIQRHGKEWMKKSILPAFAIASILVCIFVVKPQEQILEKEYEFQITSVTENSLEGHCFIIGKGYPTVYSIVLKNDKKLILPTETGITRDDSEYFSCEYDYSTSGFSADISTVPSSSYEICVDFKGIGIYSTGCYLIDGEVKYTTNPGIQANNEITENGHLLVAQNHCSVYQYKGNLYWIADSGFDFEEDGSTCIQYQLWTTQPDRLPENRIQYEFDNLGFTFEDYEIEGFEDYRVAMRPLPTEYSITAIVTGYYKNGDWVWKKYFRPVLSELIQ